MSRYVRRVHTVAGNGSSVWSSTPVHDRKVFKREVGVDANVVARLVNFAEMTRNRKCNGFRGRQFGLARAGRKVDGHGYRVRGGLSLR